MGKKPLKFKIKEVSYGRTINVGEYETVRIEYRADVPDGMDHVEVLDDLKDLLDQEERIVRKEFAKS